MKLFNKPKYESEEYQNERTWDPINIANGKSLGHESGKDRIRYKRRITCDFIKTTYDITLDSQKKRERYGKKGNRVPVCKGYVSRSLHPFVVLHFKDY